MISRPAPIGNIWRSCAVVWFVAFGSLLAYCWPVLDQLNYDTTWLALGPWVWLLGTAALWIIGLYWKEKRRRTLLIVAIGFTFGLLPLILTCVIVGFGYFILVPRGVDALVMRMALGGVSVWWCIRELHCYRQRMRDRHFVEREFVVEQTDVVLHRPPKIDLEAPPVSETSFWGRAYHQIGHYAVMLIPLAYPLQRWLAGTSGPSSMAFFVSLLGAPLAIYALGQLTCGTYLYVFVVRAVERDSGKQVVFESA